MSEVVSILRHWPLDKEVPQGWGRIWKDHEPIPLPNGVYEYGMIEMDPTELGGEESG